MMPPNFTPGKKYALDGATLNAIFTELGTCRLLPGVGYDLEVTPGKGTRLTGIRGDGGLYKPGFWVSWVAAGEVEIHPSVVSGMSGASVVPTAGGHPLTDGEPFAIGTSSGTVVALRIKAEPTVRNEGTTESPDYAIVDGGGTLDGDIEVRRFSSLEAMTAASRIALIDNGSGEVTQPGVYHVPLAVVVAGGALVQAGHIGPIGARMCSAGTLVVASPSLQVVGIDADGNIVNPPAP